MSALTRRDGRLRSRGRAGSPTAREPIAAGGRTLTFSFRSPTFTVRISFALPVAGGSIVTTTDGRMIRIVLVRETATAIAIATMVAFAILL